MKQIKIFLLDFYPLGGSGKILREILETSHNLDLRFQNEYVEMYEPAIGNREISRIILSFNPDVTFFILSPNQIVKIGSLLQALDRRILSLPIIGVMEGCKSKEMISLLEFGITDFINPPLKAIDVLPRIWRLIKHTHKKKSLTHMLKEEFGLKQLVGKSPSFLREIKKIPIVAKSDVNVLISGETGTGKELCARAIHYLSPRANKPFVPVNCGAIPMELVENELFGHIKGAFTSAHMSHLGLIQEADGGTLFLDEIDCIPCQAQAKLLRFIQEKEYRQLGSKKINQVNVRIIAATNIDLEEAMIEGRFRQDLYYRLNIIPLILPPLRDRQEDIPLLAHHFLAKYANEFNKHSKGFSSEVMQKLILYDWPGNIRELENVIRRIVVLSEYFIIQADDIISSNLKSFPKQESFKEAKAKVVEQFERSYIKGLLLTHHGNITKAAQTAQKNRRAFWHLIRKYSIDTKSFKPGQGII